VSFDVDDRPAEVFLDGAKDDSEPAAVLEPLSPEPKHQVMAGGAMGFYGLH
jgi:hypothetical protein